MCEHDDEARNDDDTHLHETVIESDGVSSATIQSAMSSEPRDVLEVARCTGIASVKLK
jgi:hypothetical protein